MVSPGTLVRISGLSKAPELNGVCGTVSGTAPNGRIFVKLESMTEPKALKPENLTPVSGSARHGSSSSGFGGMPNGFGGMAGADMKVRIATMMQSLQRHLATYGLKPERVLAGGALVAISFLFFGRQYVTTTGLFLVIGIGYCALATPQGKDALERVAARLSSVFGRPVPPPLVLAVAGCLAMYAGHSYSGGSAGNVSPASDPYAAGLKEAYQQGYDDALAGLNPRPPKHIPSPEMYDGGGQRASASSGFGIGSLFRYAMMGNYIYRMGGGGGPGGWSVPNVIANAKANPMQAFMLLSMLGGSSMFF